MIRDFIKNFKADPWPVVLLVILLVICALVAHFTYVEPTYPYGR